MSRPKNPAYQQSRRPLNTEGRGIAPEKMIAFAIGVDYGSPNEIPYDCPCPHVGGRIKYPYRMCPHHGKYAS